MLVAILVLGYLAVRYLGPEDHWWKSEKVLRPALVVGGISFALGFFGPMILNPQGNQGPMLGIFITGPLGFIIGLAWGLWRAWKERV